MKNITQKFTKHFIYLTIAVLVGATAVYASNNLIPTGEPGDATHYSLKDIHAKLLDFEADPATPEFDVPETVLAEFPTLTEIYTLLTDQDANIKSENILAGVTIFGVDGTAEANTNYPTDQTLEDNGDGTVYDTSTGLTWQKDGNNGTHTWQEAIDYCEATDTHELPGTDWRLPEINELTTIVDYSVSNPAIEDTTVLTGTQSDFYWSGTTLAGNSDYAWIVNFYDGYVTNDNKAPSLHVRCVR